MKNRHVFFSKSGFTLTGLIISLGVMSIIGLTLATFSVNSFGFMGGMSQIARVNEIVDETKMTLTGENQCTQNLINKVMAATEGESIPIDDISRFDPVSIPTKILQSNQSIQNIKIKSISLVTGVKYNDSLNAANLAFSFSFNILGKEQTVKRTIPVFVKTQTNKVLECWIKKPHGSVVQSQICMAISGGSLDSYDPATKSCVTSKGKWYLGSSETASCPTGIKPYEAAKVSNCSYEVPVGFNDPGFTATPYSMKNKKLGKAQSLNYKRDYVLSAFDAGTGSCSCSWATTITDTTGFKCKILCEDK